MIDKGELREEEEDDSEEELMDYENDEELANCENGVEGNDEVA